MQSRIMQAQTEINVGSILGMALYDFQDWFPVVEVCVQLHKPLGISNLCIKPLTSQDQIEMRIKKPFGGSQQLGLGT